MRFEVGDRVIVRADLQAGRSYNGCTAVEPMVSFAGRVVTISQVREWSRRYSIAEDRWNWSDDMFEGKEDDFVLAPVSQEDLEMLFE